MTIDEILKVLETSAPQMPKRIALFRDALQAQQPERNGTSSHVNGVNGHAIQIGPCRILAASESDNTGVTFLGKHFENGHEMTVRMVFPKSESPFSGTEVEHAARQTFSHPAQTPIRAVEQVGEFLCLCRDATGGETLTSIIAESGAFPAEAAAECLLQVARCLHDAHEAGFVNGELDESQWILDDEGQLWLNADQAFLSINSIPDAETRLAADRESLQSLWILLSLGVTSREYWSGCMLEPLPEPLDSEFWGQANTVGDVLTKLDPAFEFNTESIDQSTEAAMSDAETPGVDANPVAEKAVGEPHENRNETKSPTWPLWCACTIAILAIIAWWFSR